MRDFHCKRHNTRDKECCTCYEFTLYLIDLSWYITNVAYGNDLWESHIVPRALQHHDGEIIMVRYDQYWIGKNNKLREERIAYASRS